MIASSCGVLPVAGKETLMRPEKPTQSCALISSSGSELISDQVESSMTSVNVPAASLRLVIVRLTGVGVGV
jgi:hypothetical protein